MITNFVIRFVFEKSLKTFRISNELRERKYVCMEPMDIDGTYKKSVNIEGDTGTYRMLESVVLSWLHI